jgi:hypothetical protein
MATRPTKKQSSGTLTSGILVTQGRTGLPDDLILRILRIATIALFLGRGWQHLFWDTPYRSVLWDQGLMEPVLIWLGGSWDSFATNLQVDRWVTMSAQLIGVFLLFCAICLALFWTKVRIRNLALLGGGFFIVLMALARIKGSFPPWAQAMELAIQFSLPFLLFAALRFGLKRSWRLGFQGAVAATFIGHGLFAAGVLPTPGNFLNMTMAILGVEESGARQFLFVMGIADFIAAALLLAGGFLGRMGAWYCVLWGLATALARVVAHLDMAPMGYVLHQWLPETVFRLPHGLVPLALAFWLGFRFRRREHPPVVSR